MNSSGVGKSEFFMWCAVFVFTFFDNVLSLEEQVLLKAYLNKVSFSPEQLAILKNGLLHPKKVSCFDETEEEILHSTRHHPHIHNYDQQYAKAGMESLFRRPSSFKVYA